MSVEIPILWLDRDNTIDIALYDDGVLINHTTITRILLIFSTITLDSSVNPELFNMTSADKIVFKPSSINNLAAGEFNVRIVTYDAINTNGIVWGNEHVHVRQG